MNWKLAIIDWGIGGISIQKLIKQRLGGIPVVYFSDTGVTPYGRMKKAELVARLNSVIEFVKTLGADHILFGCNAASTVLPDIRSNGVKLEGMIGSAVAAAAKLKPVHLGVIGGRQTILSGAYLKAFAKIGINVRQRIAQPLSGMIENGDVSSEQLRKECEKILKPLSACSHILLACTHYPAIAPLLQQFVSRETIFIDPAAELVDRVANWDLVPGGRDIYFTTGDPVKMKFAARRAFNWEIESVEKARV